MSKTDVVKYTVLGSESNDVIRYIPEEQFIMKAKEPHFCPYKGDYKILTGMDEEYENEIVKTDSVLSVLMNKHEIKKLKLDDYEIVNIELTKIDSESLSDVINSVENFETGKRHLENFF